MQTEAIRVALRLRTPWEAVDLGVSMVRAWWPAVLASWLALFVPIALAVSLLAPSPIVALAVLWWLKPLFDRAVLHVLAQGVFGPLPRWSDTLSELPGLVLRSGLWLSLLPLRLSPRRSLTQPILQLENLRGRSYVNRAHTLSGRDVATAIGLTAICSGLEIVLVVAVSQLASSVMADPLGNDALDIESWFTIQNTPGWWIPICGIAWTLIEPFYVGGGFGLYLNRRIELEGWDIEVAFRSIARRHERPAGLGAALLLALACSGALLAAPRGAGAAEPLSCAVESPADAHSCIERVLAGPEFKTREQVEGWRPRQWLRELFSDREVKPQDPDPLHIGGFLARVFMILAWAILIVAGLALVGILARYWLTRGRTLRRRADGDAPELVEQTREELPPDVVSAALARWSVDPVAALGLLYAGARAHLVERLSIVFPDGATERECERLARRHAGGPLAEDFGSLTRAWVFCAYAHRLPSADAFRELCERWRGHLVSA